MSDVVSGNDTSIVMTNTEFSLLTTVSDIVEAAVMTGQPFSAIQYAVELRRNLQVQGLAMAKLLYLIHENWELFQQLGIDDNFYDVISSEVGMSPATAKKYIRLWIDIFENSRIANEIKTSLYEKPMRGLLLLSAAAREDSLSPEQWDEVAKAETINEIREIVREARGMKTSASSAVIIQMDSRTGRLSCKRGDAHFQPFGLLNIELAKTDETVRIAIDRIISNTNIMEV